jgi:hypothetical protein
MNSSSSSSSNLDQSVHQQCIEGLSNCGSSAASEGATMQQQQQQQQQCC